MKWLVKVDEFGGEYIYTPVMRTDSKVLPRQYNAIFLDGPNVSPSEAYVDSSGEKLKVVVNDIKVTAKDAGKELNAGILTDSRSLLLSTSETGMIADVINLQYYIMDAAYIAALGETAILPSDSFDVGDELDTEEKVKSYAIEILRELHALKKKRWAKYSQTINGLGT